MSTLIQEYPPSPGLQPYVETFWEGRFNVDEQKRISQLVTPNVHLELIIHLEDAHCELLYGSQYKASPDYLLIGMFLQPYEVQFTRQVHVFGIRFKPEGLFPLFGVPAAELLQQTADLESVGSRRIRDFGHRLREQPDLQAMLQVTEFFLQEQLRRNGVEQYYLHQALHLIRNASGQLSVEELASRIFISRRQLEREFQQKIGLSPKQFSRLARLNKAQHLLETSQVESLTALAHASGYSDQAHFIREFKTFLGSNPRSFLKDRQQYIVNVKME